MNYTFIILGIILVIVLYVLYTMIMKPTSVISSKTYLQSIPASVPLSTLTNANSMNYYYSLWIYVNNLNTPPPAAKNKSITEMPLILQTKNKNITNNIFYVADNSNSNVYLSLDVGTDTALTTNLLLTQGTSTPALQEYQITPSFPLQRWEFVIISINQSYLDLYLDGKLAKSINLMVNPNIPSINVDNPASINFGNGDVYVAKFQRISNSMDPQTAWNMYLSGSGENAYTNNYGLSMTLSHNNAPQSTFTFF